MLEDDLRGKWKDIKFKCIHLICVKHIQKEEIGWKLSVLSLNFCEIGRYSGKVVNGKMNAVVECVGYLEEWGEEILPKKQSDKKGRGPKWLCQLYHDV